MLVVLDKPARFCCREWRPDRADDGIVGDWVGWSVRPPRRQGASTTTTLDAASIAEKAMSIAGEICIYTNANIVVEEL